MLFSAGREFRGPRGATRIVALVVCVVCAQCSKSPTEPSPGGPPPSVPGPSPTPTLPPANAGPFVFSGAGDIAIENGHADDTARLLDLIGGEIFTLGDNAYPNGSRDNFHGIFNRTWGRHLGRIHPAPGNHEYASPGAQPAWHLYVVRHERAALTPVLRVSDSILVGDFALCQALQPDTETRRVRGRVD